MEDKEQDFNFKLGAAKYHLQRLNLIFNTHKNLFHKSCLDPSSKTPKEIMEFFYHCDAFLYELSSCFDMLLQYVYEKYSLGIGVQKIKWNVEYKLILKSKSGVTYEIIEEASNEWWFNDLRVNRDYIAHHGRPSIGFEFNEKEVKFPFFGNPGLPKRPIHERRVMFEHGDLWGKKMSELFRAIKAITS